MKFSEGFKSKFDTKQISFRSKMVSDENFRLCGGWFYDDIDENEKTTERVIKRLKPFGTIVAWELDKINELRNKCLKEKHLEVSRVDKNYKGGRSRFIVCQKGTLEELFDLEKLAADYAKFGFSESFCHAITQSKKKSLKSYFKDWDAGDEDSRIEYWETGLILGYPVLETLYRCYDVRGLKAKKGMERVRKWY